MQTKDTARIIVVKSNDNLQPPHLNERMGERWDGGLRDARKEDQERHQPHHRSSHEERHRDDRDKRRPRQRDEHDNRWEEPDHREERRRMARSRSRDRGHLDDERRSRSPRERRDRHRHRDERREEEFRPQEDDEREREAEDRARAQPTTTVYISNLPYHATEVELYSFIFEGFTGTDEGRSFSFRLNRNEATGRTRGSAFIDFLHLEAAKAFVELCDGAGLFFPKQPNPTPGFPQPLQWPEDYVRLKVEFSKNLPRAHNEEDTGHKVPVLNDWLCPACNILNFARRHECFQCQAPRMPDAQVVRSERGPMKRPTACISIQGEALMHMGEERIKRLFSGQAAVTDVRLIRDKRNKAGVHAYVRYGSVSEAARALSLLQGVVPSGSSSGLVLAFSRDVFKDQTSGSERDQAKPVETHQSWEPKEFGDAGGWEPKAFDESKEEEAKGAEPKAEPSSQAATSSGFVLDPASGYYYDAKSGYYYDPKTSLYYHSSTCHWYSFNQGTGEYKVITAQSSTATATATATSYPAPKASSDPVVGPELKPDGSSEPTVSQAKKASAVIGAAPQLNPDGLLLAAFQMDEKIEAAKAKPKADLAPKPPAPVQPIQGVIHKGKWADKKKKQLLMEAQANANKDP